MKTSYQDVLLVLEYYDFDGFNDKEKLVGAVTELFEGAKNYIGMHEKLISLFRDIADYELDKKTAKKIIYDISCHQDLSDIYDELLACDVLKDKLTIDQKSFVITLKVHDNFVVKTDLALQKMYLNDKFYYDIEEQDLIVDYCDFIQGNYIYVQYSKRRLLSYLGLAQRYFKIFRNANKIEKYKNTKNVEMIFTNKQLLYVRDIKG